MLMVRLFRETFTRDTLSPVVTVSPSLTHSIVGESRDRESFLRKHVAAASSPKVRPFGNPVLCSCGTSTDRHHDHDVVRVYVKTLLDDLQGVVR